MKRRDALVTLTAAAANVVGACAQGRRAAVQEPSGEPTMQRTTARMPVIYLPHGGGPWPWTRPFTPQLGIDYVALRAYLESIPGALPRRPRAIVVVSAHWEAPVPTVSAAARPPMLYDYSGFPEDTYRLSWPAPGEPRLARQVGALLRAAGIDSAEDARRGFDHGAFVPLALGFPDADVPTVQLSLDAGYDPVKHLAIGRALAPLRDEGVLLVGSGMSWEDFRARDIVRRSNDFDAWFRDTGTAPPRARDAALARWTDAPHARVAHPHEEHLLPMMVAAGAAGDDRGRVGWSGSLMGIRVSAVHFGA